jgi:hypothetical protein
VNFQSKTADELERYKPQDTACAHNNSALSFDHGSCYRLRA